MSSPKFIGPHLLLEHDQIDIIATGAIEQLDPEWIRLKRIVLEQNQDRRVERGGKSNLIPAKVNTGQEDIEMTRTEVVEQTSRSDRSSSNANFVDQESLNGNGKRPRAEISSKPRGRPPKNPLEGIDLICEAMSKLHPERVEDFVAGTLPKWLLDLTAKEREVGGKGRDPKTVPHWFIDCVSQMDEETLQRMDHDLGMADDDIN